MDSPRSPSSLRRRPATSDEEMWYSTVSSAPPKRRAGRTKFRETRHPVYKGVRRRNADKWVCEVREPNKKSRIWLGTFPTAEMAARAHDVAAIALRGRGACLNFADSAWRLNVPASTDPRDIQRAAAEAAEAFRPQERQQMVDEGEVNDALGQGIVGESSGIVYEDPFRMDDELHLGMQGYWDMAQGLLIEPPAPPPINAEDEEGESDGYLPLWSYSI